MQGGELLMTEYAIESRDSEGVAFEIQLPTSGVLVLGGIWCSSWNLEALHDEAKHLNTLAGYQKYVIINKPETKIAPPPMPEPTIPGYYTNSASSSPTPPRIFYLDYCGKWALIDLAKEAFHIDVKWGDIVALAPNGLYRLTREEEI